MKAKKKTAPKGISFLVKEGFETSKKSFKKGDTIILECQKSIEYLKSINKI